uniref:Uncharacterized protein n=1 Tax=Arundo donax TaxID=35708 RepID=A0A0A8ZC72_ARUDO
MMSIKSHKSSHCTFFCNFIAVS